MHHCFNGVRTNRFSWAVCIIVVVGLIIERNVEQAAPHVRTGRGASLWQVTTVLERLDKRAWKEHSTGDSVSYRRLGG